VEECNRYALYFARWRCSNWTTASQPPKLLLWFP